MNYINYPNFDPKLGMAYGIPEQKRPSGLGRVKDLFNRIRGVTNTFQNELPNLGGISRDEDQALVTKTSPTIWEYEMFRLEWERRTVLREIDMIIKEDTRLKRANHVFASTAVRRGVTVTTSSKTSEALAQKAQDVINQVMRDCQVNAKLHPWARVLLKAGDLMLNPVVDLKTRRLVNIKSLPAISMQRNDDMTGNFPDTSKAFRQIDPITLQILSEFPLWSVNHIRWDHEDGNRYGNSQYLACRGYWKKLNMTEQDLVVRRRTRAPARRLHSIGTKDNPSDWTQVEEYKAKNKLDPRKAQVATDYYGNGLTSITDLSSDADLHQIGDVIHLQEVYMAGSGVPLHVMGWGQNVNRDIVDAQMEQFKEDVQELRTLLEYGDSSPYSGLRFIFDFALALAGIDSSLIEYNFRWFENDNETADKRTDRVLKLRSAQPDPLITRKTALTIISKDIGLEGDDAIEAELEAVKAELEEDKAEQDTLKAALNPENPPSGPISHAVITASGKPTTDAVQGDIDAKKNVIFPQRNKKVDKWETELAHETRIHFRAVLKAIEPDLNKTIEKTHVLKGVYGDAPEGSMDHILNLIDESWSESEGELTNNFFKYYTRASDYARANAAKDVNVRVTTDFINPQVQHYFKSQAADRVKGINQTTKRTLRRELSKAYDNKESVAEWEARIRKVMDCSFPAGRAEGIARTELSWAYSKGLIETYNEVGTRKLQRLEVIDNRTCMECASHDGEIYDLADADGILPAHTRCRGTWVSAD